MPFFSCIVLSHNKADHVGEAINSVEAQSFADWEAIVFDSGVLYDQGFFEHLPVMKDRRVRLVRSWETEELRKTRTIASWCFNECFRKGLVRGEYVTYLCDDDLLYPGAYQTFYDQVQARPGIMAMYASIDVTGVNAQGEKCLFGELIAEEMKGSSCGGGPLDNRVDYLQLCHKTELLSRFPNDEYWPENREVIRHADGIFLEQIGSLSPIYPIREKVGENRKVPLSLNDGGDRLEYLVKLHRLQQENDGLRQTVSELQRRCQEWERHKPLRYRMADKVNNAIGRVPYVRVLAKRMLQGSQRA
jgi:glycosyltransferase involved in cell wall biosynthesis